VGCIDNVQLGGGFGPGFKVMGGWDFASNDSDPEPAPDPNPAGDMGHGTHVAGIIAGKNAWYRGVAPDANILAYRILGGQPATTETMIDAWKRAYDDGVSF
jgi:subtilisin family serine protease